MSLSPYAPDSRISAINSNTDMTADSLIERVFLESVRINKLSGGAFEPTLSPLSRLWGFGNGSDSAYLPTQEMIDSALVHIGISRCSLADGKIAKPSGLTEFNFSSITKGMGCDIVAEMLERNGSRDYMVEIGGEIALAGKNPQGKQLAHTDRCPDRKHIRCRHAQPDGGDTAQSAMRDSHLRQLPQLQEDSRRQADRPYN